MLATISPERQACDSAHDKALERFVVRCTKSQVSIDMLGSCGYFSANRARHASQRCAPGGTFFAQNQGKAAQS